MFNRYQNLLIDIACRMPQPFRAWILYGLVAPDLRQFEPRWKWCVGVQS